MLEKKTDFYKIQDDTFDESMKRVMFLKHVIENNDGYRIFYSKGIPIKKEEDLQIFYRLTWYPTDSDINREVNNGRGPVDFKISKGNKDKTIIEFKLASNSQLRRNLQSRVEIYVTKVITYYVNLVCKKQIILVLLMPEKIINLQIQKPNCIL